MRVARDSTGDVPSNELRLNIGCSVPPPVIVAPRAEVIGNGARFSWSYAENSVQPFTVIIEAGSSPGAADLGSVTAPRDASSGFTVIGAGGTYYTRLRAVNACGSTVSEELPVTDSGRRRVRVGVRPRGIAERRRDRRRRVQRQCRTVSAGRPRGTQHPRQRAAQDRAARVQPGRFQLSLLHDPRRSPRHMGSFLIDGVGETDGVHYVPGPITSRYPRGLLVGQNGEAPEPPDTGDVNGYEFDGATQFKFVNFVETLRGVH